MQNEKVMLRDPSTPLRFDQDDEEWLLIINSIHRPALRIPMATGQRSVLQLDVPFDTSPGALVPPIPGKRERPGLRYCYLFEFLGAKMDRPIVLEQHRCLSSFSKPPQDRAHYSVIPSAAK